MDIIGKEFHKSLKIIRLFFKFMGINLKDNKNIFQHIQSLWLFYFNFIWLNIDVFGEIMFVITGTINGESFTNLTYIMPCIALCLLGNIKTYQLIRYSRQVNDLTHTLRFMKFYKCDTIEGYSTVQYVFKEALPSMNLAVNTLKRCNIIALINFSMNPIFVMANEFFTTGTFELYHPFHIWYPFDAFNIKLYPFVYLHQVYSTIVALLMVYGPDCLFFVCCAFVDIQFRLLQHELETIIPVNFSATSKELHEFHSNLERIVLWHLELVRCVELLESIFTRSTLFNAISSSFLICLTGFNITAIDHVPFVMTFVAFLIVTFLQIFFFCSFGDTIMRSSVNISDAVYNSQWYLANSSLGKQLNIVLTRTQKPCKMTAFGFADINLRAFTRILSTSWSYFTLLKTMYSTRARLD